MMTGDCPRRDDVLKAFSFGSVLGMITFIAVYGTSILDFRNEAWLLNINDLTQHYLGWCLYRSSPWAFPLGLTPEYAWPLPISAMYADVIPICAVFFKLLSPLLPETFQYFGLWGLLCYGLQGGLAAVLLRRFIASSWWSGIFSLFFVVGSQMMVRMYIHTALGSQWILLLALCLLFYGEFFRHRIAWKLIWGLMGCLCVWIHGYFVPMVFLVMLAWLYMHWWKQEKLLDCCHILGSYLLGVISSMWVLGAFSVSFTTDVNIIGIYCANLDTFFNPVLPLASRFMPSYPLPDSQIEGWSYLGMGGIALLLIAMIKKCSDYLRTKELVGRYFPVILLWLACMFLAVMPKVCLHDNVLFYFEYPDFLNSLVSIFRCNGRFVWIPAYLIMLFSIVEVAKSGHANTAGMPHFSRNSSRMHLQLPYCRLGSIIVLLMLMVQLADFSPGMRFIHKGIGDGFYSYYQAVQKGEESRLSGEGRVILKDYEIIDELMKDHKYVAYTDYHYVNSKVETVIKSMMLSYYAHKNGAKIEAFYLARMPEKHLQAEQEQILRELREGKPREDTLYVIADKEAAKGYKGLFYREVNGVMLGSKRPLE